MQIANLKNGWQFLISVTAIVSGVIGWFLRGGNLKP